MTEFTDHTDVNITDCLFMRNMIGNEDTKMILIKRGKVNVEESVVDFNFAKEGIVGNGLTAVTIDSCQNVNFTNTIFNETVLAIAMEVISNERISRNFVLINNCSFRFSIMTTIQAVNITDIIIYNSFLELLNLVWSPFNPSGINVFNTKTLRVWNSTFNAFKGTRKVFVFDTYYQFPRRLLFFTLDCKFVLGNMTLQSNKTATFVDEAKRIGFITPRFGYTLDHEETEYASSKSFEINLTPRTISSDKFSLKTVLRSVLDINKTRDTLADLGGGAPIVPPSPWTETPCKNFRQFCQM